MSTNNQCLIAEFSSTESFRTSLEVLAKSDYPEDHISIVTHSDDVSESLLDDAEDKTPGSPPEEKTTAASTLAGGTLGAVLGTSTMIGPMLVAGPLLGMAAGAVGGSMLSAIESWGVRDDVGKQYEERVADGSKLILLTGSDIELDDGEAMLKTCGPKSLERYKA